MDWKTLVALLHQVSPPDAWNAFVRASGYVFLVGQVAPWILAKGVPVASNAADAVARAALASPLRPLILYFLPQLVKLLDAVTAACEKVADTFKDRLEQDLEAAKNAPAPAPAPTPVPAPQEPGAKPV